MSVDADVAAEYYLDLLESALIGALDQDADHVLGSAELPDGTPAKYRIGHAAGRVAHRYGFELRRRRAYDERLRENGLDWPERALSMIGRKRMENLRECIITVLEDDVPGDLIETGVWRGGACIFMRGVLAAYGVTDRTVWVADSFEGLPPPDPVRYPADRGDRHHEQEALRISVDTVRDNFRRYKLLDAQVSFLVGWFAVTLPVAPIDQLAVLRLDGDMYSSTIEALEALYPKLSPGGFCIVDDFALPGCAAAVHDFRRACHILEPIVDIDGTGAFWRRAADSLATDSLAAGSVSADLVSAD